MKNDSRSMKGPAILFTIFTCAILVGCERQNPYKIAGDGIIHVDDCSFSSTDDGKKTTTSDSSVTTSMGSEQSTSITTGQVGSGADPKEDASKTELDLRELDYSEAFKTASILLGGNVPTLSEIYELGNLPQDQQFGKYVQLIDKRLSDSRFASSLLEFFRYTFKMEGQSSIPGEPSRDTAPTFAARIVYEEKDWRNILTQESNTCPTFNSSTGTFIDGNCNNLPTGMKHSGILTNPGIQSLYYGNLSFRRNRFFHETFLCVNGNEQSGAEPTDNPPANPPCLDKQPIKGYNNKWPVDEIAGECNGGRINFHEYNSSNICANCHATWNRRSPLFSQFDSMGVFQQLTPSGEYSVMVPVNGSPRARLSDWLCVDPVVCPNQGKNPTAWKKTMISDGKVVPAYASNLTELGVQMSNDDEVLECAVKRIWNYAMGRHDITEIGGTSWVSLPDRIDKDPDLLTMTKLTKEFRLSGFNLKKILRTILLSNDFVRF